MSMIYELCTEAKEWMQNRMGMDDVIEDEEEAKKRLELEEEEQRAKVTIFFSKEICSRDTRTLTPMSCGQTSILKRPFFSSFCNSSSHKTGEGIRYTGDSKELCCLARKIRERNGGEAWGESRRERTQTDGEKVFRNERCERRGRELRLRGRSAV